MSKNKLSKFADMATYPHVFEPTFGDAPFEMRGRWGSDFFHNDNPIVLELGCGRGEYTVGLAKLFPDKNFIGVDIKGARMWTGATQSLREGMANVAFLRTQIEFIEKYFAPGEVAEIWLTFSDPQMKKVTKRLTSTYFLARYRNILADGGIIHLKTDSNFLFTYTTYVVERNALPLLFRTVIKPTPSISREQRTLHLIDQQVEPLVIKGRHDPCIVTRAAPVIEAAVAVAVTDLYLEAYGYARS